MSRTLKTWIEYLSFLLVRALARPLSFHAAGRCGEALGGAVFRWTNIRKRVTLENLAHAFPEKSEQERQAIALGAFRNYGRVMFEMLWFGNAREDELRSVTRLKNPDVAHNAYARGKGLILLTGHFGNWELFPSCVRLLLGWPAMVIYHPQRNRKINDRILAQRSRFDATLVPMAQSVRPVLTTLRKKGVVVLLGDQSGSKESLYIPFFGRPSATQRGSAAFALKSGAPLVMMFHIRQSDGTYLMEFEEVEYSDLTGSGEEQIDELTRRHTAVLERYITMYPANWLWMHKRWKHTPQYEALQAARTQSSQDVAS